MLPRVEQTRSVYCGAAGASDRRLGMWRSSRSQVHPGRLAVSALLVGLDGSGGYGRSCPRRSVSRRLRATPPAARAWLERANLKGVELANSAADAPAASISLEQSGPHYPLSADRGVVGR